MKEFIYKPMGVCSKQIKLTIQEDKLEDIEIIGGCSGNLQGIKNLIKGMNLEDIISKLEGIKCNFKDTSCPDQITKAIKEYLKCK